MVASLHFGSVPASVGELANTALSRILSTNWVESLPNYLPDSLPFSVLELEMLIGTFSLSFEARNIGCCCHCMACIVGV